MRPETLLLFFLLLCYGFFFQAPNWNENSRFDLVRALVEQGTTSIDDYHANTEDKAFANGHYRSDKAPGSAILGTPVYAATRALGAVTGRDLPAPDRLLPAVALAVSGLPTLLAVLVLMRFLRPLVGASWALAGGAGYGLGTIAFPFATVFFGHAAAAGFLFAAFAILITVDPGGPRRRPLLAGFLCGWAVLIEFPAALAVAILLAYATWRDRRALLPLILGGLPLAVVLLIYNWRAFGNPLSVGYAHLIYEGFLAGQGQGFLGITFPSLESLRLLLIGQRGLLRLSPWLVAAPLGAWAWWRRGARAETLACAGICLAFLIYNAGYYSPLGGATPGPRFLVPALPFAALLAGLAPRRWWPFLGAQIGCAVLLIALATAIEPKAPEFLADPIGDVWVPRLLSDRFVETSAHAHWGLQGWEPLLLLVLGAALALGAALLGARVRGRAGRVGAACLVALLVLLLVASVPLDYRAAAPTPRSPQALRVAGG